MEKSKNNRYWYHLTFISFFLAVWLIAYPLAASIASYVPSVQIYLAILFFSSSIFIIVDLFMVLIKRESFLLKLLGKSIFSKSATFLIVGGYILSVLFTYVSTIKIIDSKKSYEHLNAYGAITMTYKYKDILLLRSAPIAVFSKKLVEEEAKKLIELSVQREIALQFSIDDPKSKKTLNYMVYFDKSKHYFLKAIAVYVLLYILFWYFTKTSSEDITRWRKVFKAIVLEMIISLFFLISLPKYAHFHWKEEDFLTKEAYFMLSIDDKNYTLIIGEE